MDLDSFLPKQRMHPTLKKPCCNGKKKKSPWLEGTLNTEYRNEFIDKEVPFAKAGPRIDQPVQTGPFDPTTTYGGDFKMFQAARPEPCKPANSQQKSDAPFAGVSSYNSAFIPKAVPYNRATGPAQERTSGGEFYGNTTYSGDFVPRGVPVPPKMVQRATSYDPTGPFAGESLYKSTFVQMGNGQRAPCKPVQGGQMFPDGRFDDGTLYRSTFVPKEVSKPEMIRPRETMVAKEGWFGGIPTTEARTQFINREIPVSKPIVPDRGGDVMPKGPLEASTTYGGDFKMFQTARPEPCKPVNSQQKSDAPFAGVSSYNSAFIPKAVPYARVRPTNAYEPNREKFNDSTTHKAAYQGLSVPAYRAGPTHKPLETYRFEGQSSYQSEFDKKGNAQRRPIHRAGERVETGPFDGSTTYSKDFVPKEIPVRDVDCVECDSCAEEDDY